MYTYQNLIDDVNYLSFCGEKTGSIGKSLLGNEIYYIHVGSDYGKQFIITGAIHARENVTASLVIRQAYRNLDSFAGVYFLPMLNPDGALLVECGASIAGKYEELLLSVNPSDDFSLWKANARGVDLNNNFDAKFGLGKGNSFGPAPHGYVGACPFSEPETVALRDFTLKVKPVYTVSYHALGQEVYWDFGQTSVCDQRIAKQIADILGYKLVDGDGGSSGGYKDWCVSTGIPAVTIEIGPDSLTHPVSEAQIASDVNRNIDLPQKIVKLYDKIYEK